MTDDQQLQTAGLPVGRIYCVVITVIAVVLLSRSMFAAADRELLNAWQLVKAGMTTADVQAELGEPSYSFEPGEGFPGWAGDAVPEGYGEDHGLVVYRLGFPGPQLLLIYLDGGGRVAFVSSTAT